MATLVVCPVVSPIWFGGRMETKEMLNSIWSTLDSFISMDFDERVHRGRGSYFLLRDVYKLTQHYQKTKEFELGVSLLDTFVEKVKENIGEKVYWEPQVLADIAVAYTYFNEYQKAIDLSLYANESTNKYQDDVPINFKLVEGNLFANLKDWYIVINDFDNFEKWAFKQIEEHPEYVKFLGFDYLKFKMYDKAKECFSKPIPSQYPLYDLSYYNELINFCEMKQNNPMKKDLLKMAIEGYQNKKSFAWLDTITEGLGHNVGFVCNRLRISRIQDLLSGYDENRYLEIIKDLEEMIINSDDEPEESSVLYRNLIGMCYLRMNDKKKAFETFNKSREILIENIDDFVFEPWGDQLIEYIGEEMIFKEIYHNKLWRIASTDEILNYHYTDDEVFEYSGMSKEDYIKKYHTGRVIS
ncbi:MAG: hypothetical protein KKH41_00270 [Candidatus Thermoplasmatota archaeon]|nr:hypothetical protein [Euryarchaeota archaeon]MBU4032911.1 hypothetical protein [Candidatus Thermoplasmatota archaeon]MBU4072201.1 hypothetical protein [Candidatus Thermoplasmatota archaeon]MBU4144893.1 hypothetical protein [Candidatus Thermoplasmatota archaeon]MBU4590998.1 hypothetical protein [Candidatus Thermoplasmatota archaeon]